MGKRIITINKQKIDTEGAFYYERIKGELEAKVRGKIVAINPDNGDYFIGNSVLEAVKKGRARYPTVSFIQ